MVRAISGLVCSPSETRKDTHTHTHTQRHTYLNPHRSPLPWRLSVKIQFSKYILNVCFAPRYHDECWGEERHGSCLSEPAISSGRKELGMRTHSFIYPFTQQICIECLLWTDVCSLKNLYVDALTFSVTVFEDWTLREVKLNEIIWMELYSLRIGNLIRIGRDAKELSLWCWAWAEKTGHMWTEGRQAVLLKSRREGSLEKCW